MKQPLLLCYNLSPDRLKKISLAAMRFRIRVLAVKPEQYGAALSQLCGLAETGDPPAESPAFCDEMLVMAHFPPGLMEQLLAFMRRAAIAPVALKAVLTPTNMHWHSGQLHDELLKERQAIAQGEKAAHPGQ